MLKGIIAKKAAIAGGVLACLLLVFNTQVSLSGGMKADRATWKANYHRPAEIPFPNSNPYSESKAELGRLLFWDPLLSRSRTLACASCHNPGLSWADGLPHAIGDNKTALALRSPTLLNVAWTPQLGWTGHFSSLENVTFGPITSDNNMNLPKDVLVARLTAIPGYRAAFQKAFGDKAVTPRKIELALATFERSIVSGAAPFDHWIGGDKGAISEAAKRGFDLFNGKARCASCHEGWAFTDGSFHDVGVGQGDDIGRGALFPSSEKLRYAFKTPTLRDIARRGPYMHDGSVPTLEMAIDLYDRGGIDRPSRADGVRPLHLSNQEKSDLIAFLKTLTAAPQQVSAPVLPR